VPKTKLYEFLAAARLSEIKADQALREWVRWQSLPKESQSLPKESLE
jgi:hypothetical protein